MFLVLELWIGVLVTIRRHWLTLLAAGLISWLAQWLFPFLQRTVWALPQNGLREGEFGGYELWFPAALTALNQAFGYKLSDLYFTWAYSVFPMMVKGAVLISIWYKLPGFQHRDQAGLTMWKLHQAEGS